MTDATRNPPGTVPIVSLERPRCPACGSADCPTTRTDYSGPDYVQQRRKCNACGCRFIVILE